MAPSLLRTAASNLLKFCSMSTSLCYQGSGLKALEEIWQAVVGKPHSLFFRVSIISRSLTFWMVPAYTREAVCPLLGRPFEELPSVSPPFEVASVSAALQPMCDSMQRLLEGKE